MSTLTHNRVRAQLDALFVGDEPGDALKVRQHLRGCDRCKLYFEQLASADAALLGERHGGAGFGRRFSDAVMRAGVRTMSHAEAGAEGWTAWIQRALDHRGSWAALAVAILLLAAVAVWTLPGSAPDDRLQPRTALVPTTDYHGVRQLEVLCVSETAGRVAFQEADRASGVLRCDRDDELKFLYLNKADGGAGRLPYLALFGFDEAGRILWYRPADPERRDLGSMRIEEAGRLRGLGESVKISAQHEDGRYEIYGVFTAAPLLRDAVEAHFENEFAPMGAGLDLDGVAAFGPEGQAVRLGDEKLGEYIVRHQTLKVGKEAP
jgi:hypothetical protein